MTNWLLVLAVCLFLVDVTLRRFQYVPKQLLLVAKLRQKTIQKSDGNRGLQARDTSSTQEFQMPQFSQGLPHNELLTEKTTKEGKKQKSQKRSEETLDTSQLLKKKDERNI